MLSPWLGSAHAIWSTETARVRHATRRRRGRMAAGGVKTRQSQRLAEDIMPRIILFLLSLAVALCNPFSAKAQGEKRITILYDAFGPPITENGLGIRRADRVQ